MPSAKRRVAERAKRFVGKTRAHGERKPLRLPLRPQAESLCCFRLADQDFVALDFDFKAVDFDAGVVFPRSIGHTETPSVPGASDRIAFDETFGE